MSDRFGYKIYFTERARNRVIRWDPDTDESAVVAGEPADGDRRQMLSSPYGLAMGVDGLLLIADKYGNRICRLVNGHVEPLVLRDADGHRAGARGRRQHNPVSPTSLHAAKDGSLLCTFSDDDTVYRVHQDGRLELILGIPPNRHWVFSKCRETVPPAEIRETPINAPTCAVERSDGTILFIERGYQIVREYHPERGLRSLFPRSMRQRTPLDRGVPEKTAMRSYRPGYPTGLVLDSDETLYVADAWHRCVLRVDMEAEEITRVMETPDGRGMSGGGPSALCFGRDGTLWVLDNGEGRVRGFSRSGTGAWQAVEASLKTDHEYQPCPGREGAGIVCGR